MGTIADFPPAAPLDGSELVPLWQGGAQVAVPASKLPNAATAQQEALLAQANAAVAALNDTGLASGDLLAFPLAPGVIDTAGKIVSADPNWQHSATFLRVRKGDAVNVYALGDPAVNTLSFYTDATEASYVSGIAGATQHTTVSIVFVAPQDGFIRLCTASLVSPDIIVVAGRASARVTTPLSPGSDLSATATLNQYLKNGVATNDANWRRSNGIPCSPGSVVIWTATTVAAMDVLTFLDATGGQVSTVAGGAAHGSTRVPLAARQMLICYANPANYPGGAATPSFVMTDRALVALADVDPATPPGDGETLAWNAAAGLWQTAGGGGLLPTDSIFLAGTSIMSTDYDDYRHLLSAKTGANVINGGFSGYTPAQLATAACMQPIYNANALATILLLDGNHDGSAGNVGTFSGYVTGEAVQVVPDATQPLRAGATMIECYAWIIQHWQNTYGNLRTRGGVVAGDTEAQRRAKMDPLAKPLLILNTGLRQQRIDTNSSFSQPANWERKARAAIEVGRLFGVELVDTMRRLAWPMAIEPFFPGQTDRLNTYGSKTRDGLHPSWYGFEDLAEINAQALRLIWRQARTGAPV